MKTTVFLLILIFLLTPLTWSEEKNQDKNQVNPALVIVDIQNKFLTMMQKEGQESALRAMNELMAWFRQKKLPVILVYHTTPNYGPKPGSKEFQYPESVKIEATDIKVTKNYGNSFKKTGLDKILKDKGVNTLFICGLSGTGCIIATYYGAVDLDYNTFLIKGTILSPKEKHTGWVEEICQSVGYGALALILQGAEK